MLVAEEPSTTQTDKRGERSPCPGSQGTTFTRKMEESEPDLRGNSTGDGSTVGNFNLNGSDAWCSNPGMSKMIPLALIILICFIVYLLWGCAASPYAWKDLGDGEGMRGYAGIPLRYSVPVALAAGMASYEPQYVAPVPQFYEPYQPMYSPVFNQRGGWR